MRLEQRAARALRHGTLSGFVCLLLFAIVAGLGQARAQSIDTPAIEARTPSPALDAPPRISLLTVGPGPLFFERFGHNALVVRDAAQDTAIAYNYGMFDFGEADFLLNFVRGHMMYRIVADDLDEDLALYRAEGRSIEEQALDLTPAQARELAQFLRWNAQPENARYRYDYFTSNCSTRVRDALDRALGGALRAHSEGRSRGYTYRLDALRLMAPEPWLMLVIDLGLGPYADRRLDYWDESFVPATLSHVVARAHVGAGGRLLGADARLLAPNRVEVPPELPPDLRWPFLVIGALLGLMLGWLGRRASRRASGGVAAFALLFESLCGLGGCVLLLLWLGTDHRAAWRNENLLLLNPLCLLLLPAWWAVLRQRMASPFARALAWGVFVVAAFALAAKILPWFEQANLHWIVLLLPIHLALALSLSQHAGRRPMAGSSAD